MQRCIAIALFAALLPWPAQYVSAATPEDKERALSAIQKWRGFEGTWEGELRYVAASKDSWLKQRTPFKVTVSKGQAKAFIRVGVRDWSELGSSYQVLQPDQITLVVHAYGASGVWTENNVVVLTRSSENSADVFVQRVVNNWAGKPGPGEELIYGDSRTGSVERK